MSGHLPEAVVKEIVARALSEDIGPGDVTTLATIDPGTPCRAEIVAKAEGMLAGLAVAEATFHAVDPAVEFEYTARDGSPVRPGETVARLAGDAAVILTAERTALNFLQRMSGIATLTAQYVAAVEGTAARICDTRKTAPGLRALDKYAVRMGEGRNHRVGLFDGVLIKDNHIRAAGGLGEAIESVRHSAHHLLKVEVEAQSLTEVEQALAAGADVVMLDNMDVEQVSRAVKMVAGRCELEVSGSVTLGTVRAFAECGVDYISVGALTHSAPALDLSLEMGDG
jgi:nicotinate-nucleotide pyrophosphorylase (carboxylating)